MYPKEPSRPPSSEDLQAIAWLRGRVFADEIVYRKLSAAIAYDHLGGLAVPWYDSLTDTFGFSRQRMERRRRLLVQPPPDPDVYDAERIDGSLLVPAILCSLAMSMSGRNAGERVWKHDSARCESSGSCLARSLEPFIGFRSSRGSTEVACNLNGGRVPLSVRARRHRSARPSGPEGSRTGVLPLRGTFLGREKALS